jgi:hypothetical protein
MPIPIRLEQEHGIDSVLGEWAQHLERALRAHFPALGVSRSEHEREIVLLLSEGGMARGEVVLRWDRAAPHEINVFPQPPHAVAHNGGKGDTLAFRVAAACLIAATALWLGAAIGFWNDFLAIPDLRGKVVVLVIAFSAWILSSFALAAIAYYVVHRSHRAIDAPRTERGRQWLDTQLWPWLQGALDELQQRARDDEDLARRLAL